MFITPCIVISLYNTNQLNAKFSKLILNFNFCCPLYISNLLGSSSGRQMYMQYSVFYMQSGGQDSVFETKTHCRIHQSAHTDTRKI